MECDWISKNNWLFEPYFQSKLCRFIELGSAMMTSELDEQRWSTIVNTSMLNY